MINGAEVLKETLIFHDMSQRQGAFLLIASILGILVCIGMIWFFWDSWEEEFFLMLGSTGIFVCFLFFVGSIALLASEPKPDKYEYVVLVKEQDVAAKEIYNNYDVISINGDIWTIQGKKMDE